MFKFKYDMLIKFNYFINQSIIEVIDYSFLEILDEEFNFYYYNRKGKPSIKINNDYREKFKNLEEKIENYLDEINPIRVNIILDNKLRDVNFEIKTTEHWYEKFFRKEFEDLEGTRKYINPDIYEGIKLIYNNRVLLSRYLVDGTIKDDNYVLIKTKDFSMYSQVVRVKKISKDNFYINLITQIKGVPFHTKKEVDRTIKLHPKGNIFKKESPQ